MNVGQWFWQNRAGLQDHTTLARRQLLLSLFDAEYRRAFVQERVRASVALQIRALREQRNRMTQKELGEILGMAQTWVSKLENPEYGKMTVATLLRLADAFDADLEIKFRPFSETVNSLPTQDRRYFVVPSFTEEFGKEPTAQEELVGDLVFIAVDKTNPTISAGQNTGSDFAESRVYMAQLPRMGPGRETGTGGQEIRSCPTTM